MPSSSQSLSEARLALCARLRARRDEIEEAILTRTFAVSEPTGRESAEYVLGLRAAVTAAVDYGLTAIEHGAERSGPPPAAVLVQARKAARNRIGLEVVLRRYAGGYAALADFLQQEAIHRDVRGEETYALQRELTALFDRLVEAVSAEYQREAEAGASSVSRRPRERLSRLLAGEIVDTAQLDYELDAWHLGVLGAGPQAERLLHELARALDRRLLIVESGERTVWAWLGGRQRLDPSRLEELPLSADPSQALLGIGEPAQGLRGWRLTHRQAEAALSVALRRPRPLTRYAEVGLLAAVSRDDDLVSFLSETYLAPLAAERDGGEVLRQTLRFYFDAGRNASAAAAALGISRQTVASRLQAIEGRIGQPLEACGAEVETILRLDGLDV
jgi:hypothetical protein